MGCDCEEADAIVAAMAVKANNYKLGQEDVMQLCEQR